VICTQWICPQCQNANGITAIYCSNCGSEVPKADHEVPAPHGEPNARGKYDKYYTAIIGPKNHDYYLHQFLRFDSNEKAGASWHWPAFFLNFYWLLYRKMWRNAFLYFILVGLVALVQGVTIEIASVADQPPRAIIAIPFYVILLLLPVYANAIYYKHCKKKISDATTSSSDLTTQIKELSRKGGTSNLVLIGVYVFVFIFITGILAAIAIPQYDSYVTRSRLTEAVTVGNAAAESVANYYYRHQEAPATLADTGFSESPPSSVKQIGVDSENGVLNITMATVPIEGKSLLLVPSLDTNNKIIWKCMSQDIPEKYLPHQCRQRQ